VRHLDATTALVIVDVQDVLTNRDGDIEII
jgi:hypothetical protein